MTASHGVSRQSREASDECGAHVRETCGSTRRCPSWPRYGLSISTPALVHLRGFRRPVSQPGGFFFVKWLAGGSITQMMQPAATIDPEAELERRIDRAYLTVWLGKTREERKAASDELSRLVSMRSPRRVEEMERARGLR